MYAITSCGQAGHTIQAVETISIPFDAAMGQPVNRFQNHGRFSASTAAFIAVIPVFLCGTSKKIRGLRHYRKAPLKDSRYKFPGRSTLAFLFGSV
jgi:starvation-inducible outer membrane lipoprotein